MSKHLEARSALRPALLAAALLLALATMIALAATASAQTSGDGGNGGSDSGANSETGDEGDSGDGGDGQTGGDGDPAEPAQSPDCAYSPSLEILQDRYFARLPGSTEANSDSKVAKLPQAERLDDDQRQCALRMQDREHPNLRWHFQTRCPVNTVYSIRLTGRTQTISNVLFEQVERVEDYRCTSTWLPIMTDASDPPAGLIPPSEPVSIITVRYRVTKWLYAVVPGVRPDHSVTPPPSESHLAD